MAGEATGARRLNERLLDSITRDIRDRHGSVVFEDLVDAIPAVPGLVGRPRSRSGKPRTDKVSRSDPRLPSVAALSGVATPALFFCPGLYDDPTLGIRSFRLGFQADPKPGAVLLAHGQVGIKTNHVRKRCMAESFG